MDLEQTFGNVLSSIGKIGGAYGRDVLHSLFPKEFELYMISLELVEPINNDIEEYFTFPVNPNSINKVEVFTKTIDRGFKKIIVNRNDSFTPQDLIIKGNFGRDFKVLIRQNKEVSFNSIIAKSKFVQGEKGDKEFNHTLKSGYGSFKVLQNICNRSNATIEGKPMKLYFHNFMLGESYLVEVLDFSPEQNMASNMIWNYSLRMKIVAPINTKDKELSLKPKIGTIQNTVSGALKQARTIVSSIL